MSSALLFPVADGRAGSDGEGILADYRERRAFEERERAERRRVEREGQHADFNSADARIRAWEKVHHLRLPSSKTHPVLAVIAAATHLTLADVQEEQRLRAARTASSPA